MKKRPAEILHSGEFLETGCSNSSVHYKQGEQQRGEMIAPSHTNAAVKRARYFIVELNASFSVFGKDYGLVS